MSTAVLPDLWLPQQRGIELVQNALEEGERRILMTLPTGGGKSRIMCELIDGFLDQGLRTVLYTNRKMLTHQIASVLDSHGHQFGVRAAGHEDQRELPLQVSRMQTEVSRVLKSKKWPLADARRVLIDEAHLQASGKSREILDSHVEAGAAIIGVTATPLDLGAVYDHLIVAGTNSDLRRCGAIIPCRHYGPDEPDCRKIKKSYVDYTENDVRKLIMISGIFARVYDWWKRLNPDARPAILFAPGVAESIWFCEQFAKKGVRAAHIDGTDCWLDGSLFEGSTEARRDIMEGSRDGSIKVICNRFVLREGVDAPWLYHGIFATIFSKLQSYLQSGGRLLRSFPGMDYAIVQDHGGNWWRHGSLNIDREWQLGLTENMVAGLREERLRRKQDREPSRCPQCAMILMGNSCQCGFAITRRSRPVAQIDGTLKEHHGDIFKPRLEKNLPDTQKKWDQEYYRAKNSKKGMTFNQARALFFLDHHYWPPSTLNNMPREAVDWFKKVADVSRDALQ